MLEVHEVPIYELAANITNCLDLVSPEVQSHHRRVAYLAVRMAQWLGLSHHDQSKVGTAALLHDIGAISLDERLELLSFEKDTDNGSPHAHAFLGYALLNNSMVFGPIAPIIRFHHLPYDQMHMATASDEDKRLTNLLYLADRTEVVVRKAAPTTNYSDAVLGVLRPAAGTLFEERFVEALEELGRAEGFWLDMFHGAALSPGFGDVKSDPLQLDSTALLDLSKTFRRIIDFRSRFTATHSSGVAAVAGELAELLGFSPVECRLMEVAGNLHDIGKLAIPCSILEKPGRLDTQEMAAMRSHTYHTYRILTSLPGFQNAAQWAAFHHERLRGDGYPFRINGEGLSLGSRAMAVADVFTAITEDRPYRSGMDRERALRVLRSMAAEDILDTRCVERLAENYEAINNARIAAQAEALEEYKAFKQAAAEFSRA